MVEPKSNFMILLFKSEKTNFSATILHGLAGGLADVARSEIGIVLRSDYTVRLGEYSRNLPGVRISKYGEGYAGIIPGRLD